MSLIYPTISRYTYHPALVNLEQSPRNFDFFNELRNTSSLELGGVNESVFLFLNATEAHVFCRIWQELWVCVIPEQITSTRRGTPTMPVMRTNCLHL